MVLHGKIHVVWVTLRTLKFQLSSNKCLQSTVKFFLAQPTIILTRAHGLLLVLIRNGLEISCNENYYHYLTPKTFFIPLANLPPLICIYPHYVATGLQQCKQGLSEPSSSNTSCNYTILIMAYFVSTSPALALTI